MSCSKISKLFTRNLRFINYQIRCASSAQKKITDSYFFMPGNVQLRSSTIGQLLDEATDKSGDQALFISEHQGVSKTFYEFRKEAEQLASGLLACGLKKGDRIGICSPNCIEWALVQFAAAKAGLILVNINPAYQATELEYSLRKVQCKALVTWDKMHTTDFYKNLCQIIPELPSSHPGKLKNSKLPDLETIIMISKDEKPGIFKFNDVLNNTNKESNELLFKIEKSIQFDDIVNIQYTSGTTGMPKGVILSHHNVVNNALVVGRMLGFESFKNTICVQVPLFHCFGCVLGSLGTVIFHQTTIFPFAGFDAAASLKTIEKHRVTTVYGTPTMFVDLLHHQKRLKCDIASLKQAVVGGAPSPEQLVRDLRSKLNIQYVNNAYGTTENSPGVAFVGIDADFEESIKGLLKPVELVELKVVDRKGHLVPVNTEGELCTRGHVSFMGYWQDEEKTKEVVEPTGWYHTGDLCEMNELGYVRIVGRIKDMVIRGGENIYPQEIENFLNTHPSVQEVSVVGVPDERMGEELCAWISLKADKKLTEQELKDFCKGNISHFKIPRYMVFVTEFPKTASGKIKKFEISRIMKEKLNL